jgi:transcriptional regulator with XRE-family HTH domain
MEQVHQRLKRLRSALNLTQRKFSEQIYISQSLYGEVELGHREASDRIIQLISSRFNVRKEWIIKGEGEMFTTPSPDMQLERLIAIYNELDDFLKHCLVEHSNTLLRIQKEKIEKR